MKITSLVDPKKEKLITEAIRRKDVSLLLKKKPAEEPARGINSERQNARIDWSKLDLEKVETLVTDENGVPAWEAIERANKEGKIIIPNCVHDRMLVETEHWEKTEIKAGYSAWTGTGVIYESPDKPFGDRVVFGWKDKQLQYSVSFSVPKQFQGKRDSVLVVEHPDFVFETTGRYQFRLKVRDENLIHLLENFPKENKFYHYDERFRIPIGKKLDGQQVNDSMKYLWRVESASYVGLLARGYLGVDMRQIVDASKGLSDRLGVHTIELPVSSSQFPVSGGAPKTK